jgi:hypothetical protein
MIDLPVSGYHLEIQTASQDSISQMEREESELEKSVSLIEKHQKQLNIFPVFSVLHQVRLILP